MIKYLYTWCLIIKNILRILFYVVFAFSYATLIIWMIISSLEIIIYLYF